MLDSKCIEPAWRNWGNVPHVARVLRERHLSAAMVIAADNDRAMEG